jgi:undecaprenyl phosphate N,N'-diacetylbacillosamine 1-phosphate transferase
MYSKYFKRIIDLCLSLVAILILSPLILIFFIALLISNHGKALFTQDRPGKNGTLFKLIKFRTMVDRFDSSGNPLPDKDRITPIGRFVRASSIDELPQLINVLKGDMSLVGPRPLLIKYLPLYNERQARRHNVKPGITGWTQVNGRNSLSWKEKFELDVWYVDHVSLSLDFKIILMTVYKVFKREGINASANHTMPAFNGNN